MTDLITFINLAIALLGAITGLISLIWHLNNNKPKLKLESVHFKRHGFGVAIPRVGESIGVKIRLRNLSNSPTTIEDITIQIGNLLQAAPLFQETEISGHSTKTFDYVIYFDDKHFKESLYPRGLIKLGVFIDHTHGRIRRIRDGSFETGYFSII